MNAARFVRRLNVVALFVDTSTRPNDLAQALASAMGAKYVALPYVDARALNEVVKQAQRSL
jgi:magnesium chelatase subunit D